MVARLLVLGQLRASGAPFLVGFALPSVSRWCKRCGNYFAANEQWSLLFLVCGVAAIGGGKRVEITHCACGDTKVLRRMNIGLFVAADEIFSCGEASLTGDVR